MAEPWPRWLDGRLLAETEAVPAGGPGVLETLRATREGATFLDAHLERLERGARTLGLSWPPPWEPRAALAALRSALGTRPAVVRLVWRPGHLVLESRRMEPLPSAAALFVAARGQVAPLRPAGVKTTERATYDALRAEAQARGAFEALVRSPDDALVEGTVHTLFVVVDGELWTPPLDGGALPGIARGALLADLERAPRTPPDAGRARERTVTARDLGRAAEVLLSNSVRGVVGVTRCFGAGVARDDLPGERGPWARALARRFARLEALSLAVSSGRGSC